jgi:type I restriction enzyme S subunit
MSEIREMIQELCPDGVEFKKLGEIGRFIRGNGLQKKDFTEDGFPCIHYGQIYTKYGGSVKPFGVIF